MMPMPSPDELFDALDATWPAYRRTNLDGWSIREGKGGGQRVSATSGDGDISAAEQAMVALGQERLFMVRGTQNDLDARLAKLGYTFKDPVDVLVGDAAAIVDGFKPAIDPAKPADTVFAEFPTVIMAEIWAKGTIGPGRRDVMGRADCLKTFITGQIDGSAAGVAFVGTSRRICMAHALEVLPCQRRRGVAERMMRTAAWWGLQHGAEVFCVQGTKANIGAQSLYRKLGMETKGQYHYRCKAN